MSTPAKQPMEGKLGSSIGETQNGELQREDIFEVLSNRRRRYVLHYLKQHNSGGEVASLSELASHVAAWENDVDVAQVTYDDRKSVQTSLYQLHLPKLAENNLIEYDKRAGEIRRTDFINDIEIYLEAVPEEEISWPLVFLGISTAAVVLSFAVAVDAILINTLPATLWFVVSSIAFFGASLWYTYHHRYKMRIGSEGRPPECTG